MMLYCPKNKTMPIYKYKALTESNKKISGELEAVNPSDLEERLTQIRATLIKCKKVKQAKASFFSKISLKELVIFCTQMEQLIIAGIPLLEALSDTRDTTESPKLRDILNAVHEDVKNGLLLSEALQKHPKVFNHVFVGLISVAEKTGNLSSSFSHLAEHIKWYMEIKAKIKKALAYPILLGLVVIGVISSMMLIVVPKLVDFLISQNFELPWHTEFLINASGAFVDYWHFIFGIPIAIIVIVVSLYKTVSSIRYKIDNLILKIPFIGNLTKKIEISRFSHFFSVMFTSGIDVLESLDSASKVIKNDVLKEAIKITRQSVSEGYSLHSSLEMTSQFPKLVIRMFQIGEDSGRIDESLKNITYFYDKEVNNSIDRMVSAIQPTMTIWYLQFNQL